MKRLLLLFTFTLLLYSNAYSQVSPDYIFGSDNGSGWGWAGGVNATTSLGGSYKWSFLSNSTTSHFFKFGETALPDDGAGFWTNSLAPDLEYTGAGAKWTAYYQANMGGGGAIFVGITNGNYYVVKTQKQAGNNIDFAVFDNGAQAPTDISSVVDNLDGANLEIDVQLSGGKSAVEKIWVRYTTDKWTTSTTIEASLDLGGNLFQASIPYTSGTVVEYYAYTTIQQAAAPAEADADFFTVAFRNNNGKNYRFATNITGSYYIGTAGTGPGGTNPNFFTLKEACDLINDVGTTISGNCTFYITSNLTEPVNVGLGKNPGSYTITFKPYTAVTPAITFTQTSDNGGASGGWVIGVADVSTWNIITTNNIIIDGSNSVDGTTQDLTITNGATSHSNTYPIRIAGDANSITVKNMNLITANSSGYAISISPRFSVQNYIPDNILVSNCNITATVGVTGTGIGVFNSGAVTVYPTGLVFANNNILARNRGIYMTYAGSVTISNNTIAVNQTSTGMGSMGIGGLTGGITLVNIYNNRITQLQTANTGGSTFGIRGIQASGGGTWNIYNNFITGFTTPATGTTEVVGIRVGSASNVYNNTIIMNNVNTTGSGTTPTAGIVTYTASVNIRNNIIITEEDDFASYCIYASSLPTISDYNNLYRTGTTNANIGFFTSARATLEDWQTGSSKDANSKSKAVTFNSATDLHLSGASNGDTDLIGTPIALVTTDIDGEARNATYPYMGADEASTPLPVELSSLNAAVSGTSVTLKWTTATEVNSYQFQIEQRSLGTEWSTVSSVQASGNSNSPKNYQYAVESLASGKYQFRLKMIDADGSFEYSEPVTVEISTPMEFRLSQNYPNPFNPTTTLDYALPFQGNVQLLVYSINGELVRTLVSEVQAAGNYSVTFDASQLASGTYIYRLIATDATGKNFTDTKKMLLMK